MTRGSPAEVIEEKPGVPNATLGAPSGGVLVKLKHSARNSRLARSRIESRFIRAISASLKPGPRTGLRELVPKVNWGATVKAPVSNQRATVRLPPGKIGLPIRFGRWVPNPAKALKLVACVTARGKPDCKVTMPVI